MNKLCSRTLAVVAICGSITDVALAAPIYSVTDIGSLGGTTIARAINASGQIVGYSTTAAGDTHAFLYSGGAMTDLTPVLGTHSEAYGINASGQIVGLSTFAGQPAFNAAVLSGGTAIDLGKFGQAEAIAVGISDAGDIAVRASTPALSNTVFHSFLLTGGVGGTATDVGTLGGTFTFAYAMGADGTIVGGSGTVPGSTLNDDFHAFSYKQGAGIVDLGTIGSGRNSIGFDANAAGHVTGMSDGNVAQRAVLHSNGNLQDLGPAIGGMGINSDDVVVGSRDAGAGALAMLFADGLAYELQTLIDVGDPLANSIHLVDAVKINDSGLILALGCSVADNCTSSIYSNGCPVGVVCRSFLLTPDEDGIDPTPVPTPAPLWLVVVPLGWMVRRGWRDGART